jgi:transcriptional regulator with XRE-family HTH domain
VASAIDQARLEDLLARTGMNDRQIGELIGVSQPTIWRLRNGRVVDVRKHLDALERHLGLADAGLSDEEMIANLVRYSRAVPALRDALLSLHRIMHNSE